MRKRELIQKAKTRSPLRPKRMEKDTKSVGTPDILAPAYEPLAENDLYHEVAADLSEPIVDANQATGGSAVPASRPLIQLQRRYGNRIVQRMVAQTRQSEGENEVAPEIEEAIQRARGGGQPLDRDVRRQMDSFFEADFGSVRVHTDDEADTLSRALDARAFTIGEDVFFRHGEYNSASISGCELLAHELTHVAQQGGGVHTKLTIGTRHDEYEQEAERRARMVSRCTEKIEMKKIVQAKPLIGDVQLDVMNLKQYIGMQTLSSGERVQRQTQPTDPLKVLLDQMPITNKDYATWILKAEEEGFAEIPSIPKQDLEDVRDEKKIGEIDTKESIILAGLPLLFNAIKGAMNRWTDAGSTGEKPSVKVNMLIRGSGGIIGGGLHGSGRAVDFGKLDFTGTADRVVEVLDTLPVGSYEIGLPFQGEFFPLAKKLEQQQQNLGQGDKPVIISDGLILFRTKVRISTYNPITKKWSVPTIGDQQAQSYLISDKLKKKLKEMTDQGFKLTVFPDNNGHLHVGEQEEK